MLGISAATVNEQLARLEKKGYLRRTKNRARSIELISETEEKELPSHAKLVKVPVLGQIAAGLPIFAAENMQGDVYISDTHIGLGNYFSLVVNGESMMDIGINNGDYVVVKQQPVAESGEIVAALIGDEATVKRLKIEPDKILLMPENRSFSPIDVTHNEEFRILGKVVHWMSSS